MATATSIHDRLADIGDSVLMKVTGGKDAGGCCADNTNICYCDYQACWQYGLYYAVAYAYDCLCECKQTSFGCTICGVT